MLVQCICEMKTKQVSAGTRMCTPSKTTFGVSVQPSISTVNTNLSACSPSMRLNSVILYISLRQKEPSDAKQPSDARVLTTWDHRYGPASVRIDSNLRFHKYKCGISKHCRNGALAPKQKGPMSPPIHAHIHLCPAQLVVLCVRQLQWQARHAAVTGKASCSRLWQGKACWGGLCLGKAYCSGPR